jgi:crossover junction endodeoxyribonuclease RusA
VEIAYEKGSNFVKKVLKLITKVPPSVNHYMEYRSVRMGRKRIVKAFPSKETVSFQKSFLPYVKKEMQRQKWDSPDRSKLVMIDTVFYFPRKRLDANNYYKVPLDVMEKAGVYYDDACTLPITKNLFIDKHNPRMEMTIYESSKIGIFNDLFEYNDFIENNCSHCRKDQTNCTILKALKENRIHPEATSKKCRKIVHRKNK